MAIKVRGLTSGTMTIGARQNDLVEVDLEDVQNNPCSGSTNNDRAIGHTDYVEIAFEGEGIVAVEAVQITLGSSVRTIVACAAAKAGYAEEDALLFIEDDPRPIRLELIVSDTYPHRRKHHVHRVREIEVVVHYMSRSIERRYPPSAKVDTVLAWALREYGIDAAIAPEFELAAVGSTEELSGSSHIGGLIHHPCHRLELNLIRGVIPNGGAP